MADQVQAAATQVETPAAAVEGEGETPVVETPADGAQPAEGAQPETPAEPGAAAPVEIDEETLRSAAMKFANKAVAAARRFRTEAEAIQRTNVQLTEQVKTYEGFVNELRTNPFAAIKRAGFASVKDFVNAGMAAGGEPAAPAVDDRVANLERELRERDERASKAEQTRVVEESKRAVFAAIDGKTDKYDLATTDIGHSMIWEGIEAYAAEHGHVPDEAVWLIAEVVEKDLETKFSKSKKFSGQRPAAINQGATVGGQAATPTRTGGKTLTSSGGKGAPVKREYSMDPAERRKQISAELAAEGLTAQRS